MLTANSQLCEAYAAHRPNHDKPDQTPDGDNGAQHGDIIRLGAVGELAHARKRMPRTC